MTIKNAAKLTVSRGKVSAKAFLYDVVIILVLLAVVVAVLIPAFSDVAAEIGELNIGDKAYDVLAKYNAEDAVRNTAVETLSAALNEAVEIFANKFLVQSVIIIAIGVVITRILFALKTLPMMDVVNSFMSTNSDYDFASNFVHNIKPSFRYSLIYSLFCLPFDAALALYVLFGLVPTITTLGIFGPSVVVIIVCAIFALRKVLLTNWVPEMLVNGGKAWSALGYSIRVGIKNFMDYFSQFFGFAILVWATVIALSLASFGVAALILVPMVGMFSKVYDLVDYYERRGMRYYAERDDVVVPEGAEAPVKEEA